MTDNPFDIFDDEEKQAPVGVAVPVGANPFDAFDEEEEAAAGRAEAPSPGVQAPTSQPLPYVPGMVFDTDPAINEALTRLDAQNRQAGNDAINAARGNGFIEGLLDPQQYVETAKGVVPGAIKMGGSTLSGAGAGKAAAEVNVQDFAREQLALMDRVDRGEAVAPKRFGDLTAMTTADQDIQAYAQMTPEQRVDARARLERSLSGYVPTPTQQQGLYKAGEAVTAYAKTVLPAAAGYEESVGRQLGEGLGSMVAGLPAGWLGRVPSAVFFGAAGSGEAVERAVAFDRKEKAAGRAGLTDDQIQMAGLWGVAPGTTDMLPVEALLGRLKIPQPFRHWAARGIARIGGQAALEGMQEGGQQYLQNLIAREIYSPDQMLAEGVLPSAGLGGGVGGLAQSAKEIARLWVSAAAGRRARNAPFPGDRIAAEDRARDAAQPEAAPPSPAAPEAAPPVPEDAGQRGVDVLQFIRAKGGLQPSGELDAVDATRYPGLVNGKGLDADKMREAMVEAGYLEEAGPDAPAVTTPQDVYDLVGRAIGGERIVPIADREADVAFTASQTARDEAREFLAAEQTFTIPEIARLDAEIGEPVLRQAYDRLDEASRREVIDRNRRGEDVGDLIEEMAIRAEDAPTIAAMVAKRGLRPEQVAEVREVIARERPELLPDLDELVETIPQRVTAAPGASRRAMEVADAIRQTAEEILPAQVRVRVVDTLGRPGDDGLFAIRAFHGTPHDFDRFDLSKIGTGEGAQVFGHGLYFAENEGVAGQYLDALGTYTLDGKSVNGEIDEGQLRQFGDAKRDGYLDDIIADYQRRRAEVAARDEAAPSPQDRLLGRDKASILEELDALIANATRVKTSKVEKQGSLYEVELDAEPHQLLDHDAKLADQPAMLAKMEKLLADAGSDVSPDILRTQSGSWAYSELEAFLGSADAASRALKDVGIPGLRYLDEGSRDAGDGTRNIVIFDDSLIKITHKNGKAVSAEERQAAVDAMFGLRRTDAGPIAEGRFDPNELLITIAADALDPLKTLKHEGIDAIRTMGLFTGKQWATLEAAARKQGWVESNNVRELYADLYGKGRSDAELQPLLIEEAIAEQFSAWRRGEKTFKRPIEKLFAQIQAFLERLGNTLRGRGFQTADDIFAAVRGGEIASRAPGAIDSRPAALQATAGILADAPARQASAGIDRPSESLANLIASFNKALGLTVRQGRIDPGLALSAARTGGNVRGQASRVTGVVRLRVMQEFDTLAHEGGHRLEMLFKRPLEAVKLRHAAELTPLASPGPDALSEGFAEWFRRWVTNPAASRRTAPGFEQDFERFLGAQAPAMLASLRDIRDGYQAWLKAPSGGVVAGSLATTVQPGSTQAVMREINDRGFRNTIQSWVDKLYTTVFDDLHPINLAVQDLLKIAQANLPAGKDIGLKTSNDAYKLLRLGRDAYAAGHMDLLYGVAPYRSTQAQGPSFRDALAKAFGGLARGRWNEKISTDFGAYLVSRRMVQEWARFQAGEISNPPDKFSLADHQQSIADFEKAYPQFKDAAAMVHTFLGNMLAKKRDAGLITSELYDTLIARKDYVPVLRDMTDRGGEVEGRAPARKDKQSIIKRFRGSQRDVVNPLESIAKDAYETAAIIARNDAVKALDALARAAGPDGGRFAERIPAHEMQSSRVNIQEAIKKAADDAGIAAADLQVMIQAVDDKLGDNAIAEVWKSGELNERGEPIVYMWEGGKRIPIRLADGQFGHDMLHAITGLNREASGWFVNMMSLPSTAVRLGVTASLDFIGANYIRDQMSAWVLTRDFVPFYDGAKGIYSDLRMKEISRIYSRAGGIFGGANVTSLSEARIKREVLELRKRGIRVTLNPLTRDFWRMTEFSETGTRIAVFEKAFTRAKADGLTEWEAAQEAAFAARDYIDFGRRGSKMLAARRLIPFFNAMLQGLDRTLRGMSGKIDDHRVIRDAISPYIKSRTGQPLSIVERRNLGRAARVWGYMVVLGMFGLAQSLLYRDDEEYEEISDYIRNTHWLFKIDGEWVRIPKPFELAVFSNIFERTFEYTVKDDPKAIERMTDGLFQILTPPHSIPGAQVTVEAITNYEFFSGRPIVGRDLEGLAPELQFNAYASEFGKYLGQAVDVSPAYIDHFVTGFGASYGREFLNATDQALPALGRATGGAFRLPTSHAAETAIADYFLIRRFTKDATRGAVSSKQFWDLISESNGSYTQAANSYKLLVDKIRDAKGAQEYLDSLPEDERAFALLEAGNSGSRAKLRTMHPLNRAKEIVTVASGLRKEINLHRLFTGKDEDDEAVVLSPAQMRTANDVLSDISMREARNALIALNAEGWAQKKVMPVEALWAELAAAAPEVHEIALERLKSKKLPSFEDVQAGWPEARKRLLEEGQEALLSDLYAREVPSFGRREYQQEIRP